jgi:hypothetical protein
MEYKTVVLGRPNANNQNRKSFADSVLNVVNKTIRSGIIFSYDGFFSNVFCVCGSPFYVFFFSFRLA